MIKALALSLFMMAPALPDSGEVRVLVRTGENATLVCSYSPDNRIRYDLDLNTLVIRCNTHLEIINYGNFE